MHRSIIEVAVLVILSEFEDCVILNRVGIRLLFARTCPSRDVSWLDYSEQAILADNDQCSAITAVVVESK